MQKVDLKAEEREVKGKKVKHLRNKGLLPAVVYGHNMKTMSLCLNVKEYKKAISGESGTNVIINLSVKDGKEETLPVITHAIQHNAMTDEVIHVDFQKINMKEKIHTKVPIECLGEAIGVKEEAGILVQVLNELEINCLPMDIPPHFEINVAELKIGDAINVSDLKTAISSEIEILTELEALIVHVVPPAKEEVVEPTPLAEGEVPAEGEAPAEGEVPDEGAAPAEGEAKKEGGAKPEAAKKAPKKEGK